MQKCKRYVDTLQVTHEGTTNVKRSRINTLTHEYELFRMNPNETTHDMQKRFTHIVNHLASLGKIFSNEDIINKVLIFMYSIYKIILKIKLLIFYPKVSTKAKT